MDRQCLDSQPNQNQHIPTADYLQQENLEQLKESIPNAARMSYKGSEKPVWPVPDALFLDWKQIERAQRLSN